MTDDELRDYLLSFDNAQDDGLVAINASFRRIYAGEFVYVEDPHAPIWRVHPTAEIVDTQLPAWPHGIEWTFEGEFVLAPARFPQWWHIYQWAKPRKARTP